MEIEDLGIALLLQTAAVMTSTKGFPPWERRPRRDLVPIAPRTALPRGWTEL
jgi:hypothetical protein